LRPWIRHRLGLKYNEVNGVDEIPDPDKDICDFPWEFSQIGLLTE